MDVIVFVVVIVAVIGTAFGFLAWRVVASREERESIVEWFRSYSVENYRPMQRLLNEADYRFLESQPGYKRSIAQELRAERKEICKLYLRQLRSDFQKLVRVGKLMIVEAPSDRSDLAEAISRVSSSFYWNLFLVHVSLTLPMVPRSASRVRHLVHSIQSVHEAIAGRGRGSSVSLTA